MSPIQNDRKEINKLYKEFSIYINDNIKEISESGILIYITSDYKIIRDVIYNNNFITDEDLNNSIFETGNYEVFKIKSDMSLLDKEKMVTGIKDPIYQLLTYDENYILIGKKVN
jgi:hypothetical protein